MRKHDYLCETCSDLQCDVSLPQGEYATCLVCGSKMEIYYGLWTDVALEDHGRSRNEKLDSNGYVKNWGASDDPLTKIEVIGGTVKDRGVRTFTPEQQASFRAKILVDGDSPKLRQEVLAVRRENLRKSREEYRKKAQVQ